MTALPPEFRRYALATAGLSLTLTRADPLGPHDVRVAIKAASLNYRDLLVAKDQVGVAAIDRSRCRMARATWSKWAPP